MDNTCKSITRFLMRTTVATIPLLLLVATYMILDPFKIVNPPDPFFESPTSAQPGWNKGWVSVTAYDRGYKSNRYDSFIFGSSLAIAFRVEDWKKYLPENARPFHFESFSEHIYGIMKKMQYIENHGDTIRNALLVFDEGIFTRRPNKQLPYYTPPQLTGWYNYPEFHYTYLKYFLNRDFLKSYIPFLVTGDAVNYSKEDIFSRQPFTYDKIANEENMDLIEAQLKSNPDSFYQAVEIIEYPNHGLTACAPAINDTIASQLRQIAQILHRHGTDYRIVFGPNRKHEILSPEDTAILNSIFDTGKIYRYAALDTVIDDLHYYYDNGHYRTMVCTGIIDGAYSQDN